MYDANTQRICQPQFFSECKAYNSFISNEWLYCDRII